MERNECVPWKPLALLAQQGPPVQVLELEPRAWLPQEQVPVQPARASLRVPALQE